MSPPSLPQGAVFAGRYRVVRCLAQGGMGAVYEVLHIETERSRALKIMLPDLLQSEEMRSRFRLEARVTARINSEYIVDVLDAGIDETTKFPFLVMEFLEGEDLEKRLARAKRFKPHEVVTYLHQAALGLDKTHKASIVHRDLKPGNLMLTEREVGSPRIKVLDFGIAKLVAEQNTAALATQPLGTPIYMAPEQIRLDQTLSPAVDIFALGMIAYTLLVGSPYWADEVAKASNVYGLIGAVMQGPREPAGARAKRRGVTLPPAFDAWFAKVTAVLPSERFATASAAIVSLAEVFDVAIAQRSSTLPGGGPRAVHAVPAPLSPPEAMIPDAAGETVTCRQDVRGGALRDPSTSGAVPTIPHRPPDGAHADRPAAHDSSSATSAFSTGGAVTATNPNVKKAPRRVVTVIALTLMGILIAVIVLVVRSPGAVLDASTAMQGAVVDSSGSAPSPVSPSGPAQSALSAAAAPSSSASAAVESPPPKNTARPVSKPPAAPTGTRVRNPPPAIPSIRHD